MTNAQLAHPHYTLADTLTRFSLEIGSPLGDGGGRRDRTDDPLLAKQVLSQLSYAPGTDFMTLEGPVWFTVWFTAWLTVSAHRWALTAQTNIGGSGWIRTNDPRLIKTVL
jgi:hypothetical protein